MYNQDFILTDGTTVTVDLRNVVSVQPIDDQDYTEADVFGIELRDGTVLLVSFLESTPDSQTYLWQAIDPD